jgi:hypothetical protein
MSRDIAEKRVELLKDTFPQLRTFAVLSNTDHPGERSEWRATQQAAQALGIEPVYVHIPDVQADPEYTMVGITRQAGFHTNVALRDLRGH